MRIHRDPKTGDAYAFLGSRDLAQLEHDTDLIRAHKNKHGRLSPVIYARGNIWAMIGATRAGTYFRVLENPKLPPGVNKAVQAARARRQQARRKGGNRYLMVSGERNGYLLGPGDLTRWMATGNMPETAKPQRGGETPFGAFLASAPATLPLVALAEGSKRRVLGSKPVQAAARGAQKANVATAKGVEKGFRGLARLMDWVGKGTSRLGALAAAAPVPGGRVAGLGLRGIGGLAGLGASALRAGGSLLPTSGGAAALTAGAAGLGLGGAGASLINDLSADEGVSGNIALNALTRGGSAALAAGGGAALGAGGALGIGSLASRAAPSFPLAGKVGGAMMGPAGIGTGAATGYAGGSMVDAPGMEETLGERLARYQRGF